MKTSILFTYLTILTFVAFANDLKAEKKALIETIKSNYDSWYVNQNTEEEFEDSTYQAARVQAVSAQKQKSIENKPNADHIFSDFTFKITNNQAVVQFQVDYQTISAFLEKEDGRWKLVCAAIIPPDL